MIEILNWAVDLIFKVDLRKEIENFSRIKRREALRLRAFEHVLKTLEYFREEKR